MMPCMTEYYTYFFFHISSGDEATVFYDVLVLTAHTHTTTLHAKFKAW